MGWGWKEPPPPGKKEGRSLGGFVTPERAKESAIYNSSMRRITEPGLREQLWKSLECAGWTLEWSS